RITGKAIPHRVTERRPGDPATLIASSEKARSVLGWKPLYSDTETLVSSSWQAYKLAEGAHPARD
ncbi:MAG: UDP-glucose 4-epimerase GalE, partial [Spirochaetaceae bacterium]|nr:UDP-glucose 4-epimerase GalE [Spirochaetaceae bacterium]